MKLGEHLEGVGRPLAYYPSMARMLGSVKAAIFLCQLVYWTGKQHDPNGWIYKTAKDITHETGLSRREQETARGVLVRSNIIAEVLFGVPATLHYRVNLDRLTAAWEDYLKRIGEP